MPDAAKVNSEVLHKLFMLMLEPETDRRIHDAYMAFLIFRDEERLDVLRQAIRQRD